MRKIFLLVLVLYFCLAGCGSDPVEHSHESTTIQASTAQTSTRETSTTLKPLPLYMPESIQLEPDIYIMDDFGFRPTKRRVYYKIPIELIDVYPEKITDELFKDNDICTEPTEMAVVTMIKYCNTSKEAFKDVLGKIAKKYETAGTDVALQEEWELPNPDIIYTFDNDIINAYYRRENPVVPDWSKTKTYESYAEYQKANE